MSETAKIRSRVLPYIHGGRGLDLGCGYDKIVPEAIGVNFDWGGQGDSADFHFDLNRPLPSPDLHWDFVYSSHLLEHLATDPHVVLQDWWRTIKHGRHLILYLPHKELYKVPNPEHLRMWTTEEIEEVIRHRPGSVIVDSLTENPETMGADRYSFLVVAKKQ